jgi:flagellar motor switch protein FliN/FliY
MAEEQPSPPSDPTASASAPVPPVENPSASAEDFEIPTDTGGDPLADLLAAAKEVSAGEPLPGDDAGSLDQASIDELLKQANFEDPSAVESSLVAPDAAGFKLPNFPSTAGDGNTSNIELLRDVELNVKIELGRARMLVEDVLKLAEGSVVELDKLAGDPVDVFVNDRLVARGEVLVLNDNFCVRVNEIMAGVKEEGT